MGEIWEMKHSVGKERGRKKTNAMRMKASFIKKKRKGKMQRKDRKEETERKGRERDR